MAEKSRAFIAREMRGRMRTIKRHALAESGYAMCRASGTKYLASFQTDSDKVDCKSCLVLLARQRGDLPEHSRLRPALLAARTFPGAFTVADIVQVIGGDDYYGGRLLVDLVSIALLTRLKKGVYCIPGREPAAAPAPVHKPTIYAYEARKRELGIHVERQEAA